MSIIPELDKKTKSVKTELDQLISSAFEGSSKHFNDRENNRLRFEGEDTSLKTRKEKHQAKFVSGFPNAAVEQKASFLTESITSLGAGFLTFHSKKNSAGEDEAIVLTRAFSHFMSNAKAVDKIYKFVKDTLVYGTGILKIYYDYQTVPVKRFAGVKNSFKDGQIVQVETFEDDSDVVIDQPNFKNIKINNFWVDPNCSSLETARYIITRELINKSELEDMIKGNKGFRKVNDKNFDIAEKTGLPTSRNFGILARNSNSSSRNNESAEYDVDELSRQNFSKFKKNPLMELLTVYRPGTVQLVVNGIPITEEESIYPGIRYPFIASINEPITGRFYGKSDIAKLLPLVRHYEEGVNLTIDNYTEHMRPTRLLDATLGYDAIERLQRKEPGVDVVVPDVVNAINELRPTPFDTSFIDFNNQFITDAKTQVSINPLLEGQNPGSGIRSEGSLQLFQQLGATRISVLIQMLQDELSNLGKIMVKLLKLYGDEEVILKVAGAYGEVAETMIKPGEIPEDLVIKVNLSPIADAKRQSDLAIMENVIRLYGEMDVQGTVRMESLLAEYGLRSNAFEDIIGSFETDPERILIRQNLRERAAGRPISQELLPGFGNPSPATVAQQQNPAPFTGSPPEGQLITPGSPGAPQSLPPQPEGGP